MQAAKLQCSISKSIKFETYMNVFKKKGREPKELLDMKQVSTQNNILLQTILSNLCTSPGYAFNVNGAWYQFHIVSCWQHAIRVAQVLVGMPTLMPLSVRYVDIVFSA
jgi:hypothetical protein